MEPRVQPPTFDEIFADMKDFDLSNCISCAVEEHYGHDALMAWPAHIPIEHRIVHYIWSTTGYLECEGFARFFNLRCHHSAFPECFKLIALPEIAAEIRKTLNDFPKNALGDTETIIKHFGSWEKLEEAVDEAESKLYRASDSIQKAHAHYVREHKAAFETLLPEIRLQNSYLEFIRRRTRRRS